MIGVDPVSVLKGRLAAHAVDRDAGLHAVAIYEAFARWTAETWFLRYHPGSVFAEPHVPQLTEAERLGMVAQINREALGLTDHALDRQCAGAVRQAFQDRVRELRTGWST